MNWNEKIILSSRRRRIHTFNRRKERERKISSALHVPFRIFPLIFPSPLPLLILASASIGRAPVRIKNTRLCPFKKKKEKRTRDHRAASWNEHSHWLERREAPPPPGSLPGKIIRWPRWWNNPWCQGARGERRKNTRGKESIKERIITSRARLRNCFVLCCNTTGKGRGAPLSPRDDYYCRRPSGLPLLQGRVCFRLERFS